MKIELRDFAPEDFDTVIGWVDSPEFLMQWAGLNFLWPLDQAQLERYLGEAQGENPKRKIFSALDGDSKQLVGHVGLNTINPLHKHATLAAVLIGEASARGGGTGEAMVRQCCAYGFEQLGLHRIRLDVFDFNHGAIACYEKVGFVNEGVARECRKVGEEYWSAVQMGILRPEWDAAN